MLAGGIFFVKIPHISPDSSKDPSVVCPGAAATTLSYSLICLKQSVAVCSEPHGRDPGNAAVLLGSQQDGLRPRCIGTCFASVLAGKRRTNVRE
jgi:hypothetical protein